MDPRWQPGQLLFAGFEGVELPRDLERLLSAGRVGGTVLFARNLRDPHQVRSLCQSIHAAAPEQAPVLLAIDQEGGRVQRLREPWTIWPPMRTLGELDDPKLTGELARALAKELADLGIHLDFAPVADVDTNVANPVIGDRSFSREPTRVAKHVMAFVNAMQAVGVAACAKHFPGHGDTDLDSHVRLPSLAHDIHRLREVELVPFRAAIDAGVASVMTAHVMFPTLDKHRPATISPEIMAILREQLAYDGVVFGDDLEMKAVAEHFTPERLVHDGLTAGLDAFLVCRKADLRDHVLHVLERAKDALLEHPLRRLVALKHRFAPLRRALDEVDRVDGIDGIDGPPYPEHLALAQRLRSM